MPHHLSPSDPRPRYSSTRTARQDQQQQYTPPPRHPPLAGNPRVRLRWQHQRTSSSRAEESEADPGNRRRSDDKATSLSRELAESGTPCTARGEYGWNDAFSLTKRARKGSTARAARSIHSKSKPDREFYIPQTPVHVPTPFLSLFPINQAQDHKRRLPLILDEIRRRGEIRESEVGE